MPLNESLLKFFFFPRLGEGRSFRVVTSGASLRGAGISEPHYLEIKKKD